MDYLAFARALLREIDTTTDWLSEQLLAGGPQDFLQYRVMLARRNGLIEARDMIRKRLGKDERAELVR